MLFQGFDKGGIETLIKLHALAFPDISFVALSDGPVVDWLRENSRHVDVVPGLAKFRSGGPSLFTLMKMPWALSQARRNAARIDEILRPRGIRIVHAHWLPQQIMAGYLRKRGYKSVWQINNNMNPRRLLGLGRQLQHRMARWGADLLLPASDFIAANWEGCGVPMQTIRNAAVPVFSSPNELPEKPIRSIVAGRLVHPKGHHHAVEAVIRARQAGLDVVLDIYGGPLEGNDYGDNLRRMIDSAGCTAAIRLLGLRNDIRLRHQDYHLGLQCRIDPEPCSLWVCETLVDGLPLIASASGGTPELVEEGVTGLLYRPGDAADLGDKLIRLVRDQRLLKAMRRQAFERGQRLFTLQRFALETMTAYNTQLTI